MMNGEQQMQYRKEFKTRYGLWALVTGGSTGIGLALSELLAARGMNILIVARDPGKLGQAKSSIQEKYKVDVQTLSVDLFKEGAVSEIADFTKDIDVGLVVLNAGKEVIGHFTKRPLAQHEKLMRINVVVPTQMAHIFAERFVAKNKGALIFVSSLFGYQGVPIFTSYCASKSYVLTLGEGLSVELKPYGVDVLVVSPGPTDTDMLNNMVINFRKMPIITMSAKTVAKAAINALGKKISVVPGLLNKIYVWENRLLPRSTPIKMFGMLTRRALNVEHRSNYLIEKNVSRKK